MKAILSTLLLIMMCGGQGLSQHIRDLIYLPPADSLSTSDFEALRPYLRDKRLWLVGEANHGSHEFSAIKAALIKYAVEEMGVRDVAIEANFAKGLQINEYIAGRTEDDPVDLANSFYVWPFRTEEFADIIVWMRAFNERQESNDQVKLWGVDMQQAYPALEILYSALAQYTDVQIPALPTFTDRMDEIMYQADSSVLSQLSSAVKAAPAERNPILQRCMTAIAMQHKFLGLYNSGANKEEIQQYRDSCMAENVQWILDHVGKDRKLIVWAHNSHIQKAEISRMKTRPMGHYLHQWLADDAYHIGFDFNTGTYIFPHPRKEVKTVSEDSRHHVARLLDDQAYALYFIPFSEANQSVLRDTVAMRYNQGMIPAKYSDLYDALFFVDQVTPIKVLP